MKTLIVSMMAVLIASGTLAASSVSSYAVPQLVAEINTALADPVSDSVTVTSPDTNGTVTVTGFEGMPAELILKADQGDDAGDTFSIRVDTSEALNFGSDQDSKGTQATKLSMGNTGILTMKGGAILDNSTSATELNITETTVKVTGAFATTGAATIGTDLIVTGGDITGASGTSIEMGEAAAGTLTLTGTNVAIVGTAQIGTLTGLLKGASGTVSAATSGTDYLAPNAVNATNVIITADAKTNTIIVLKGLITSWVVTQ